METLMILGFLMIICLLGLYLDWGRIVGKEEVSITLHLRRDIKGEEIIPLFEKLEEQLGVCVLPYLPVNQYRVRDKSTTTWTNWMNFNINKELDYYYNDYEFRKILGCALMFDDYSICYIRAIEGRNSWYSSCNYKQLELVFEPLIKWPWNKKKIKKQKQFTELAFNLFRKMYINKN